MFIQETGIVPANVLIAKKEDNGNYKTAFFITSTGGFLPVHI